MMKGEDRSLVRRQALEASLDLVTVAEGIEHVAQAERVRELGCGLGQGYLFSRPVRADDVVELLLAQRPARPAAVAAA